jgi:membrane-anchored protein YejM (alkaline phosphatase superfamily)
MAIGRAANAVFFLTTAAYCILSYNSFAYYQFIRPEVFAWPTNFIALYHVLFLLFWLITALTLWPYIRGPRRSRTAIAYLCVTGAVGVWLFTNRFMADVDNSGRSLAAGLIVLVFPLALAGVDHVTVQAPELYVPSERRLLRTCALTALVVWLAYAIAAPYRLHLASGIDLSLSGVAMGLAASAIAHVMVFTALFLGLALLGGLAAILVAGGPPHYWLLVTTSAAGLAVVLYRMAFSAVGFTGAAAWISACALGTTIAGIWSGIARHRAADRRESLDAVDLFLAPVHVDSRLAQTIVVAALPVVAFALAAAVEQMDWDFLLQKLSVLVVWLLAFSLMYSRGKRGDPPARASLAAPALVLAAFWLVSFATPSLAAFTGDARLDPEFVLDRYAAVDPSFHFIEDARRANTSEAADFYGFLKANTALERVKIEPIEIDFVRPLGPPPGPRPNIFLFIIDSLRRDYVSPYNTAVNFTPAIGAFARESFVFDRAFTRYGATGLAVPSIWIGGMTLHMQYIQPFTPMNTLLKLLDAASYRRVMGMDSIAERMLEGPSPLLTELDKGIPVKQYDFCRTLGELSNTLDASASDPRPIFAYTLPQNVHIAIAFETKVPEGESYPGFVDKVAAPVHRLDRCFGDFIEHLKAIGQYDRSVIIVTSDHGDSLGEEGRFGHSYTVFPEVMRVPLIVHLPMSIARTISADLTRVAFTADITPTLYALLGYHPADYGPLYGSPLFGWPPDEYRRRRDPFLLSSSYGAVYGMLRHNGRFLYITDAVEGRDYAYDLADGGLGRRVEITEAMRALNWRLIREQVEKIGAQYHFTSHP